MLPLPARERRRLTGQGSPLAAPIAALPDRADIRPLDISSALQILLAEVRAGLDCRSMRQ